MLKTRLWIGASLIFALFLVLVFDLQFAPYFPILGILVSVVGFLAATELRNLLPAVVRPPAVLAILAVLLVLASPWLALCASRFAPETVTLTVTSQWSTCLFAAVVALGFLYEMVKFHGPNGAIGRLCGLTFMGAYLGLLPSFLIDLRWLAPFEGRGPWSRSTAALVLCIFTPKVGDIAAYFAGRALGQHLMSPVLSPKKTIEGAIGGVIGASLFAMAVQLVEPVAWGGVLSAAILGALLGVVGIFGDLAESLLKRDAKAKDASTTVPGFGGVLDVIDSILFCAPVVYCWLH
jgi:phosphatidate cytidylyltransferase